MEWWVLSLADRFMAGLRLVALRFAQPVKIIRGRGCDRVGHVEVAAADGRSARHELKAVPAAKSLVFFCPTRTKGKSPGLGALPPQFPPKVQFPLTAEPTQTFVAPCEEAASRDASNTKPNRGMGRGTDCWPKFFIEKPYV